MKLRVAKKIVKAIDGARQSAYSDGKKLKALDRLDRCKDFKNADAFWHQLMRRLGVEGRAEVLAGTGAMDMAFGLLMREEW